MKLANVATQQRDGRYVAYYNGDDAPFLDGIGYTKECAIHDLYQRWKLFHYPDSWRFMNSTIAG